MSEKTFDLSSFELDDTGILTVQNAQGTGDLIVNGEPVTIELYGPGSDVARQFEHKEALAAAARMRKVFQGKIDPKAEEQEQVQKLVRRTKRISANFPVEPEALYANRKLVYIHAQVHKFLADEANFSKASSQS
jgi:cytochrome c556